MSTTTRDAVIEMIQRMPDDVSVADIMAELYLRTKVDQGLRQLDDSQSLEHEEVVRKMRRWLAQKRVGRLLAAYRDCNPYTGPLDRLRGGCLPSEHPTAN